MTFYLENQLRLKLFKTTYNINLRSYIFLQFALTYIFIFWPDRIDGITYVIVILTWQCLPAPGDCHLVTECNSCFTIRTADPSMWKL